MKIIWHRNDLRIHDNRAVTEAGGEASPVYIFDPEWLENDLVSDHRIEFVLESLKDLNRQYVERGTHLSLLHGNPSEIFEELDAEVYFNRDANHFRQEKEEEFRKKFEAVSGTPATSEEVDRENWDKKVNQWFRAETYNAPKSFCKSSLTSDVELGQIRNEYSISPDKEKFGEGGRKEALSRLEKFKDRIKEYSGCISSPSKAEASTSQLSPYIRYACISPREVYQTVKDVKNEENLLSVEMFLDRIVWQQHFNKKLEDNPELFREAINPVYRKLNYDNRDKEKNEAWKQGRTGFPLVDASMRALVETGWLNFRMRAMCASFFSYILKQWWKIGADFFYKHLIDGDVAINYYQWQMQSGLVGVHANRIYNPTKQVEDNDPEGDFIRKYIPELRPVPDKFIAEPWKMPEKIQSKCGVKIGKNYPNPIVTYDLEVRKARDFFKKKAPEAYAAFEDDKVWRKASLGSRHDREEILDKAGKPQSDLKNFLD